MPQDRRTKRTKQLLKNAFIELLSEKKLTEITVKELCDKADINRGTFYLHYQDIYAMKQQLEEEIYADLFAIVNKAPSNINMEASYLLFLEIFRFIEKEKPLLNVLLGPNGDISFLRQIRTIFKERYLESLLKEKENTSLTYLNYSYNYIASGFIGLVEDWMTQPTPPEIEEMAKLTSRIVFDGIPSLIRFS